MSIETETNFKQLKHTFSDERLRIANRETTVRAGYDMQQYVPLKTGALRRTRNIKDHETIVWDGVDYARIQYLTQFENYTTPGTGPHWDMVASGNHMDAWERTYLRGLGL